MNIKIKKLIFILIMFFAVVGISGAAYANKNNTESNTETIQSKNTGISSNLYSNNYGELSDGKAHYQLDIVPLDKEQMEEEENKSWWQRGWSYVNGTAFKEATMGKIYEAINIMNNYVFQINIGLTQFMLSILTLSYEFDFVNQLIEKMEGMIQNITGLSGLKFGNSGLFGGFGGIIAVLSVGYAIYLYFWRRAAIESIGEMLKTVLTFSVALLLFANYSLFLTGVNQITTEASQLVIGKSVSTASKGSDQKNDIGKKTLKENMMDNIWTLFVDRPYLFMQYGTDRLDEIGEERVRELLELPSGQARQDYVIDKEVKGKGNNMMTYGSVMDRATFSPLYLFINGVSSIPIFLLALLLLVLQFWFLGIAAIAPFALLFGAVPGQFGVLNRYFVELGLPLFLKIIVSFGALIVFAISELIYSFGDFAIGGVAEYIVVAVLQFIILILMFMLRNRIKNIFSAGSREIKALRAEISSLKDSVARPIKTGIQGTATVAGAIAGGVASGGAGIAAGASLGNQVGKTVTGEGSISQLGRGLFYAKAFSSSKGKEGKLDTLENLETPQFGDDKGKSPRDTRKAFKENEKSLKNEPVMTEEIKFEDMRLAGEGEYKPVKSSSVDSDSYEDPFALVSLQEHLPPEQKDI